MESQFDSKLKFEKLRSNIYDELNYYIKNEYYDNSDKPALIKINNFTNNILTNMENWIHDEIPEEYKKNIFKYIDEKKWDKLIEAFKQKLTFGTSGVRGKLIVSLDNNDSEKDLLSLNKFGFNSNILRGPNSINEITITKNIIGLINYMKKNSMSKIIIGYDSRTLGKLYTILISNLFIKNNISVILFEEPNTLPELSFAVTYFKADLGIEITASHNDKRYNGYKIITKNGSPPPVNFKDELTHEIFNDSNDLLNSLSNILQNNSLDFNSKKLSMIKTSCIDDTKDYSITNLHSEYLKQLIKLVSDRNLIETHSSTINIGYSALHGTGYDITSHLFKKLGIENVKYISKMILPNSLFPCFPMKQILDPSDANTAKIVVNLFIEQHGSKEFKKLDFLCYTDPDADRLGIIVPTPIEEQSIYGQWKLLKANDVWTLFLWYMLEILSKKNNSILVDLKNSFIVKSFVTSDSLKYISKKYGLECLDGKVGFSDLTSIVFNEWKKNKTNIGMFEESCGFGLAGNQEQKLHILEKDGMLSLTLLLEILAYTKSQNISIQDILNNIYLDPEIGYFATLRKELPADDVFEGINGEIFLRKILKNVENLYDKCLEQIDHDNPILIYNLPITSVKKYSTGKYDELFWDNFPDEGVRFFLDSETNHITIRSSGTEPKLRIFVQYRINDLNKENIIEMKSTGESITKELSNAMEKIITSS